MFKAFLMFQRRLSKKLNRTLDETDIVALITKSTFHCYLCSEYYQEDLSVFGQFGIPSIEELVASGVIHLEAMPPCPEATPPFDIPKLITTVVHPFTDDNDEEQNDSLFVESWDNDAFDDTDDCSLDYDDDIEIVTFGDAFTSEPDDGMVVGSLEIGSVDTEEPKVMVEGKDNASESLKVVFDSDTVEKTLKSKPIMLSQCINGWGAAGKVNVVICLGQWGADDVYPGTKIGEEMVAVYNQRMLIAVFEKIKVFDPGGGILKRKSKTNPVQQ